MAGGDGHRLQSGIGTLVIRRPGGAFQFVARSGTSAAAGVNGHPARLKVGNRPVSCPCREGDVLASAATWCSVMPSSGTAPPTAAPRPLRCQQLPCKQPRPALPETKEPSRVTSGRVPSDGPAAVIVLAAGEGTRMRTATPKMLNEVCGRPMLGHVLAAARELRPERLILVVSDLAGQVASLRPRVLPGSDARRAGAPRFLGHRARGAHGDRVARRDRTAPWSCCSPTRRCCAARRWPAWSPSTRRAGAAVTVLTARRPTRRATAGSCGTRTGRVAGIVEEADATPEQREITEISSGMFAFDGDLLADAVKRVPAAKATGEEYLTEVPAILRADGHLVASAFCPDFDEIQGVNNQAQLAKARRVLNERLLDALDGGGRDHRGSGEHLDRRRRQIEPGARISPGHPAGGPDQPWARAPASALAACCGTPPSARARPSSRRCARRRRSSRASWSARSRT